MPQRDVKKMSASTLQREFQMDDVLDYIKTGIGSIIEDEVTQRFVAEELKVLLARCHCAKSGSKVPICANFGKIEQFIVKSLKSKRSLIFTRERSSKGLLFTLLFFFLLLLLFFLLLLLGYTLVKLRLFSDFNPT
jgi:hypothetical protein